MNIRYTTTSHETFTHASLDSLGYDWERIANPRLAPRYPFKIYLPQCIEDVVAAVKEAKTLGQSLTVRSKGHSSNDLVVVDHGNILLTEKLDHILAIDESGGTVTVESGIVLAELDRELGRKGFGLPVIGDHNHITAGGFASVGGISPASHRYGMFVDTVAALDFVDWNGDVHHCSRTENADTFFRALTGTGQHGVIATLTCTIIPIDKDQLILRNDRFLTFDFAAFVDHSFEAIRQPGEARMERGLWIDLPLAGAHLRIGQFSRYLAAPPSLVATMRSRIAYGYLGTLGYFAGRLPRTIDLIVHYLGIAGIVLSPRYASIRDIESFTDKVIDETVSDPTRMFIALAPVRQYPTLIRDLYELFQRTRQDHKCFTFLSFYVKAIHSEYLAHGRPDEAHCEIMAFVGIDPAKMTDPVLENLVSEMDDLCISAGAYRYMHSRTVKDAARRVRIDPNASYGDAAPDAVADQVAS